jgi:hypothetical protein
MAKIINGANAVFDKMREDAGTTKIEMAVFILEQRYDTQIPPAISNGPLK